MPNAAGPASPPANGGSRTASHCNDEVETVSILSVFMPSPISLPDLSSEEVVDRLAALLADLSDLSAYVDVNEDDTITLKTFSHQPACVTLPPPTIKFEPVSHTVLSNGYRCIEILSKKIDAFEAVQYGYAEALCLSSESSAAAALALPPLTPDQIMIRIASLLQVGGDLSAYFEPDPDGMRVVVRNSARDPDAVPPTALGQAVPKDRLGILARALTQLNAALGHRRIFESDKSRISAALA